MSTALEYIFKSQILKYGLMLIALTSMDLFAEQKVFESPRFASVEDAVVAASNRYNPTSIRENREFMGAVFEWSDNVGQSDEQQRYSYTSVAGKKGAGQVSFMLKVPENAKVVAFWHTHGDAHYSRKYFSHIDTALVAKWKVPFYLADYTGYLKIHDVGARTLPHLTAERLGLGANIGYAKGSKVRDAAGKPIKVATRESRNRDVLVAQLEDDSTQVN